MNSPTYIHKCEVCNAAQKENIAPMLKEHEQEDLLHKIYIGEYDVTHLPTSFYLRVAHELQDELYKGFGTNNNDKEQETLLSMRRNIYYFSAAKTYQMVRAIKESGKDKHTFLSYKQSAGTILTDFIGAYLFAEKDHTLQVGKTSKKWFRATTKNSSSKLSVKNEKEDEFIGTPNSPLPALAPKKIVTYLEYRTMKDDRVRPAHIYLDGIIRKSDDKFWDTFYPPNGWLCRCKVKSYPKGEDTELKDFDLEEALQNIPPMFRTNFGKEGVVFTKEHPYFKVDDKELAKRNFNLPPPYDEQV